MIDEVTRAFSDLPHMKHDQAMCLAGIIARSDVRDVLELGTLHGKSAAYIGAILDDLGRGRVVTLDAERCLALAPNVHDVVARLGLRHRVEVRLHPRSFTMTLMNMIAQPEREHFDLVYLDGGHTWDTTGYCFLLVDLLLRPGGLVLFDDLDWTIARHVAANPGRASQYERFTDAERETAQVRRVFELLPRERGYEILGEPWAEWGLARKPLRRGV